MKKILRTIQTSFPLLQDLRFSAQLSLIRLLKRPHEYDFNAISLFPKNEKDVYVDIGANRGASIQSILVKNSKCKIIAFEPNPLMFKKLYRLFRNNKKIELYNCGLGDKDEEINIHIPFYKKYMFDALASFNDERALNWLEKGIWRFRREYFSIKKIKTRLKRLDDFRLTPSFMKIDVEGYEREVLMGGEKTLSIFKPILLIEGSSEEVASFLEKYNYKPYKFDKQKYFIEGYGDLNTFYITKEKLDKMIKNKNYAS